MARTTRKERMERRQVALQKVSNGMGISEVFDFVSAEWGCSRRTARRDCHWALEELQLGLDTHDLAHLISHMATTLQATLGHSSSATTGHYVASNPRDSSSLRLE